MANWNMVWLQPKSSASTNDRHKIPLAKTDEFEPSKMSVSEPLSVAMEKKIAHLSRPTLASQMKRETHWMKRYHVLTYMEREKTSWNKMELRKDCERCMWNENGTLRGSSTKI